MNNLMALSQLNNNITSNNTSASNNLNNSNQYKSTITKEEFGPILDNKINEEQNKKPLRAKKPQSFIRKGLKTPILKDKF